MQYIQSKRIVKTYCFPQFHHLLFFTYAIVIVLIVVVTFLLVLFPRVFTPPFITTSSSSSPIIPAPRQSAVPCITQLSTIAIDACVGYRQSITSSTGRLLGTFRRGHGPLICTSSFCCCSSSSTFPIRRCCTLHLSLNCCTTINPIASTPVQ